MINRACEGLAVIIICGASEYLCPGVSLILDVIVKSMSCSNKHAQWEFLPFDTCSSWYTRTHTGALIRDYCQSRWQLCVYLQHVTEHKWDNSSLNVMLACWVVHRASRPWSFMDCSMTKLNLEMYLLQVVSDCFIFLFIAVFKETLYFWNCH